MKSKKDDLFIPPKEDELVLVPDGIYKARCLEGKPVNFYSQRKVKLDFIMVDLGEQYGKKIPLFLNIAPKGKRNISSGSFYYLYWIIANRGEKPTRRDRMTPEKFKDKLFKIKTRTVSKNRKQQKLPKSMWHSVVDAILELIE
ncbi:MAG: hypothetical protein ABIA04_00455 [Pseudomonadota bacterium]